MSESKRLKLILNVMVLAISLIGVARKNFKTEDLTFFQKVIMESVAPLQRGVTKGRDAVASLFSNYIFVINAALENRDLKNKISELENSIYKLEELRRENVRLKGLLGFGKEGNYNKVLAQIVAWDASSEFKILRINKGSNQNIQQRDTVVTSNGLVGYVYRVSPNYADVLTILDQSNRVDAIVDRTRSHGIIEGFSDTFCIMKYVTRTEAVILGDQVISSGLGGIYPKGVRIGKISKIERESYGIVQYLEITPNVDFGKLEEVVVLIKTEKSK